MYHHYQTPSKPKSCMPLKQSITCLLALVLLALPSEASARKGPTVGNRTSTSTDRQRIEFRNNCDNATAQRDMEVNNVRARLTTGGDVWWDGTNGRYVVPKPPDDQEEVSSLYAGAVWLGGLDPGGGLKISAQQYGRSQGEFDYYTGPLTSEGTTSRDTCSNWDMFFNVTGQEIRDHRRAFDSIPAGTGLDPQAIADNILGWPGDQNPYFFQVHGFELPGPEQGSLAGFFDRSLDGIYDPTDGDYPIIEIRDCPTDSPQFPEEMSFWIYNDAGNVHRQSNTTNQIRMEVQVQAFAYTTSDDINNMTFQRYKLINRAPEDIIDTYFAMWVDPDLGCFRDDFVGTDTTRSLAYVYNQDARDGVGTTCECDEGIPTYCDEVPILGVDYFRGPRAPLFRADTFVREIELGMSSFIYLNNCGVGDPEDATCDPQTAPEYYNYLQGRWRDGTPFVSKWRRLPGNPLRRDAVHLPGRPERCLRLFYVHR